jgi:hypothetical protein
LAGPDADGPDWPPATAPPPLPSSEQADIAGIIAAASTVAAAVFTCLRVTPCTVAAGSEVNHRHAD